MTDPLDQALKRIDELEAQLAEKDRQIENYKKLCNDNAKAYDNSCEIFRAEITKLREALERIKGINQDCFRAAGDILPSQGMVLEIATKALGGEG